MNAHENVLSIEGTPHVSSAKDGKVGAILEREGKLGSADIGKVLDLQRAKGIRFGEAALRLGLISPDDLLGAVSKQYGFPHLSPGAGGVSRELVTAYEPFHPRSEELRALRTQLLIRWSNTGIKRRMLAVVSPGSGEGRSYVAANLAVVFSQLGQRTLLIDGDLRAPRQHRIFNVANREGLSTVLSGRADITAVNAVPGLGTLSLLPAGACPPNPQELLLAPAFTSLLEELESAFDVILFDTPPAHVYADAQSLAFRAGSALVLARKDRTRFGDTADVIRELGDSGTHVMGTLFNAI